jgi:hypothetical protein
MYEYSHLLVTRPGKTHFGRCTADTAIHLGDRNSPPRLQLDLIEQPERDARREGQHDPRIARHSSRNGCTFAAEAHTESK